MTYPAPRRLARDTQHAMIGGVCAGLARRFGISTGALRLAFVISCVLPGPQFVAYLVLWLVMPRDDRY
jgi:phage shock protein PspC (stress-responsive transcriptional regulator)